MAGRAFGVAPIPSAHLRHREAAGVAIAGRSSVTRDAGRQSAPELPRDERPGAPTPSVTSRMDEIGPRGQPRNTAEEEDGR